MDKLTPFDKLTSSFDLQMMKLMIPYMAPESRQMFAIYIKFMELQNTMHYFSYFNMKIHSQEFHKQTYSPMQIFEEILPYMPENISAGFEQMKSMMDMLEMMQGQDMSEMFQMFSQDNNVGEGDDNDERMDEQPEIREP